MTLLEYELEVAKLHAQIKVLRGWDTTYISPKDQAYVKELLEHNRYVLNKIINSNIPF